jgi:hypothetical protein
MKALFPRQLTRAMVLINVQTNGMRNIAWGIATTQLIILLDADFKPSPKYVPSAHIHLDFLREVGEFWMTEKRGRGLYL